MIAVRLQGDSHGAARCVVNRTMGEAPCAPEMSMTLIATVTKYARMVSPIHLLQSMNHNGVLDENTTGESAQDLRADVAAAERSA